MTGRLSLGSYDVFLTQKLGQGTFGVVYKGRHKTRGFEIAAKQCELKREQQGAIAMTEIKHFQQLQNHPHIVELYDFNYKNNAFWMIMEFCDAGDLEIYLVTKNPTFNEQKNIMFQCASAIHYMHSRANPAVHRDIKPHNIIMRKHGSGAIVKITDFGLAKTVEITDSALTLMFNTKCGTPGYMAPEFYMVRRETKTYGKHVDVFSLGLVFLAMILHTAGNDQLAPQIGEIVMPVGQLLAHSKQVNAPLPDVTQNVKEESKEHTALKDLIRSMTVYEPQNRITMPHVESALIKIGGSSPLSLPNPKIKENEERCDNEAGSSPLSLPNPKIKENEERCDNEAGAAGGTIPTDQRPKTESGDIGYVMVKRAVEEAYRERRGMEEGPSGKALHQKFGDIMPHKRLRVGERVVLDADERRVERLQPGYGLWKPFMKRYLGQYGIVTKTTSRVKVQFEDGQVVPFNPKLLYGTGEVIYTPEELEQLEHRFEPRSNDIVHEDREEKDGFVVKRRTVFRNDTHLRVGEKVKLDPDEERVRSLQPGYGNWTERMNRYLGQDAVVMQVARNVKVRFDDDREECFNPKVLIGTGEVLYTPEQLSEVFGYKDNSFVKKKFKSTDVVRVCTDDVEVFRCMQEATPTGWHSGMEAVMGTNGLVNRVKGPEEIAVEFLNNDRWVLHPEILQQVDMTGCNIEAGDMVVVLKDTRLLTHLKHSLENWDDIQMNFLGEPGIVKSVVSKKQIVVDMNSRVFSWHPRLLKIWAKGEDVMTAILKENRRK